MTAQLFLCVDPASGKSGHSGMVGLCNGDIAKTQAGYLMWTSHCPANDKNVGRYNSRYGAWHYESIAATCWSWGRHEVPVVVMEIPPLHGKTYSSSSGLLRVVELVEEKVRSWGWNWVEVTSTEAKKALTGKGTAKKEDMLPAAQDHLDLKFPDQWTIKRKEAVADAVGIGVAGMNKWEKEQGRA